MTAQHSSSSHASTSLTRRSFVLGGLAASLGLAACSRQGSNGQAGTNDNASSGEGDNTGDVTALHINQAAWSHDADNDVYYQIGVPYCTSPQATAYESMGIYVPGAYLSATDNGDGTFTCSVDESGSVGSYTAATAPILMPVNTAGYSAQEAPTSYSAQGITDYLSAGAIYVYAGCRGRANGTNDDGSSFAGGAPWGVTDLKAAIRCLRYNADILPGSTDRIFTFGHSGGGAQSALVGATGDSALYTPYLEAIGAVMRDDAGNSVSDAVCGSMCWCPITELDVADEAYEWMMGQFSSEGTRADGTFTAQLSDDLVERFADWVNNAGITKDGETLALSEGGEGLHTSGSYYDAVVALVERSLNNFLADTEFPYTPSESFNADGGFGGGAAGGAPSGDGGAPSGEPPSGNLPSGTTPTGGPSTAGASGTSQDGATYETVDDYISALNADEEWLSYDSSSNTATVSSLGGFVRACKAPTKDVGAFDALDRSQAENDLFGTGSQDSAHFDANMALLLKGDSTDYAQLENWSDSYPDDYVNDLGLIDDEGNDVAARANAYNPLYYLLDCYAGKGMSTVAPHWRIRTGIEQGDTSLTTEMNLALALEADDRVSDVDFETVWGQGHTMAERTGTSTDNLLSWIVSVAG